MKQKNEFEPQEMKEPVEFIGNFAHSKKSQMRKPYY